MAIDSPASPNDGVSFPPAPDPPPNPAPPTAGLRARCAPWCQIAAILVIATIVAWGSRFWPPVPWNAIIWLGSAITIGCLANKGVARLFFVPVLLLIFPAALVANEVAAHVVFGTCLYD